MSAWRPVVRLGPRSVSQRRKAVACLTWPPAWRRPAGVVAFFSARLRSRGRTSQEIYSRLALADAQQRYDDVISDFPV